MVQLHEISLSDDSITPDTLPSFWELHARPTAQDQDADEWCSPPPTTTSCEVADNDDDNSQHVVGMDSVSSSALLFSSAATADLAPDENPSSNDSYWALVSAEGSSSETEEDADEETSSVPSLSELPSDIAFENHQHQHQHHQEHLLPVSSSCESLDASRNISRNNNKKRSAPSADANDDDTPLVLNDSLQQSAHSLMQKMKQTQETRVLFLRLRQAVSQQSDKEKANKSSSKSSSFPSSKQSSSHKRRRVEETRQAVFESLLQLAIPGRD